LGPQQPELRGPLDLLMTFRVVIVTTLMICTLVIELMYRPLLSLQPFYLLGVVTYAMTIAYAVLSRTVQAVRPQVYAQLIGDLGVVTGFVYLTGGAESPFSFQVHEAVPGRSEEHTSELQSLAYLVCRLLLEKKK